MPHAMHVNLFILRMEQFVGVAILNKKPDKWCMLVTFNYMIGALLVPPPQFTCSTQFGGLYRHTVEWSTKHYQHDVSYPEFIRDSCVVGQGQGQANNANQTVGLGAIQLLRLCSGTSMFRGQLPRLCSGTSMFRGQLPRLCSGTFMLTHVQGIPWLCRLRCAEGFRLNP